MNSPAGGRPWRAFTILILHLRVESPLQRPIDPAKVSRIVREFVWRKVKVVRVGRYPDGTLAVADGQHTCRAIQRLYGDIPVDCEVTEVANDAEFRQLVDECNPAIETKPGTKDRFWMDHAIGAQYTEDIISLAKCGDLEVVRVATSMEHVNCVVALVRLYRSAGISKLRDVFLFHRDAFKGQHAYDYVLEGIHLFLEHCGDDPGFKRDRVLRALRQIPFATLVRQAETTSKADRVPKAKAFARILKSTYNEQSGRGHTHIKSDIP